MSSLHGRLSGQQGKLHYKTKLSLALCGIVLIPVAVGVVVYHIFFAGYNRRAQLERCDAYLADAMSKAREMIGNAVGEANRFETEEGQMDFLKNPAGYSLADKIDIFRTNRNILLDITQQYAEAVKSVKVYGQFLLSEMITPGPMYPMGTLEAEKPEILEMLESAGKLCLYHVGQCSRDGEPEQSGEGTLNVYRAVRDVKGGLIAVNEVAFSVAALADRIPEAPFDGCILVYAGADGTKVMLYGQDREVCARVYREYEDGGEPEQTGKYIVRKLELLYTAELNQSGRSDCICLFIPKSAVRGQENRFWRNALLITMIMMLLIAGLIQIISHGLTKELYQLLDDISLDYPRLVAEKEVPEAEGLDEFGWIRTKFNHIISEISNYSEKAMRAEYEQRILKAELMQELISPHFLYNTLDGLRWSTDDPNLIRVIENMVNFYRMALNKGETFATLERELEMARSYLEVQAFAYESQFRYEVDCPDSLRNAVILKYILQPVLENALVHGIDKRGDRGCIRIRAWEEAGSLKIEIADNGAGMSEEKIAQLSACSASAGYGIRNVIQRIRLFYGEDYGVVITSAPGEGTAVLVTLPMRWDKNTGDREGSREDNET